MRILALSGSSRAGSLNTRLAQLVARVRPDDDVVVSDLHRLPFYDGDVEAAGTPAAVSTLRRFVADADAVVIVTPEYNGSVPGLVGNAVDWLSRPHGSSVLRAKPVLVLSASPSRYGGIRAARHLRTVLTHVGAHVAPVGLSVARAHQRLGEEFVAPDLAAEVADVLHRALEPRETAVEPSTGVAAA